MDLLKNLFQKYYDKTASAEERAELTRRLSETSPEMLASLIQNAGETLENIDYRLTDDRHQAVLNYILDRNEKPVITRSRLLSPSSWIAAAVFTICIITGVYYWISSSKNSTTSKIIKTDLPPGKEGAILILADGSQINLDTIQQGAVALQGGAHVSVINGRLMYDGKGHEMVYNTMTTPKGRQYQITLPDGTKVWLNATSSIRYPTVFTGNERSVEITGEAYFEVAKDTRKPFKVNGGGQEIEVLGTSFNMNVYDNEPVKKTTLITGKIRVSVGAALVAARNPDTITVRATTRVAPTTILNPNEQAQISTINEITKIKQITVQTNDVIAWKNGLFNFEGATLAEVMRQLERWYDINVVYEKEIPNIRFVGKMTKDIPLSGLLLMLEKSKVHFRWEADKTLVVTP